MFKELAEKIYFIQFSLEWFHLLCTPPPSTQPDRWALSGWGSGSWEDWRGRDQASVDLPGAAILPTVRTGQRLTWAVCSPSRSPAGTPWAAPVPRPPCGWEPRTAGRQGRRGRGGEGTLGTPTHWPPPAGSMCTRLWPTGRSVCTPSSWRTRCWAWCAWPRRGGWAGRAKGSNSETDILWGSITCQSIFREWQSWYSNTWFSDSRIDVLEVSYYLYNNGLYNVLWENRNV